MVPTPAGGFSGLEDDASVSLARANLGHDSRPYVYRGEEVAHLRGFVTGVAGCYPKARAPVQVVAPAPHAAIVEGDACNS